MEDVKIFLSRVPTRIRKFFVHRKLDVELDNRVASGAEHALPDFVISGVMKCGTTSLFDHISRHPSVFPPLVKGVKYYNRHFERGEAWYRAHFPLRSDLEREEQSQGVALTGESSPDYLPDPLAAQRLRELTPDARLIVLLRNPVSRAFSHYHYRKVRSREPASFADAIEANLAQLVDEPVTGDVLSEHAEYTSYIGRGLYMRQLRAWMQVFPPEQILILSSEEFAADAQPTYSRVLDFLGLPDFQLPEQKKLNTGKYSPMDEALQTRLQDYFRPHNAELYKFAGRDFGWDK